jgi:hypothetical protein
MTWIYDSTILLPSMHISFVFYFMFLNYFIYFLEMISLHIFSLFKTSVNPTLLAIKYSICSIFSPVKNIATVFSLNIFKFRKAKIIEDVTLCFSLTRYALHINIVWVLSLANELVEVDTVQTNTEHIVNQISSNPPEIRRATYFCISLDLVNLIIFK